MSTTCVQILLPGEEEEDDPNHQQQQQQQKPLLLTDVATVEMAPDASSVRFRNGGRTSPVAGGEQNNHPKDSGGGTTNNVMAVTAELTLPPSSSYNHHQANNGSHQLIDGDTCPQCCSPSAKTSFMTFEELADINNIVVAKSPNWFIIPWFQRCVCVCVCFSSLLNDADIVLSWFSFLSFFHYSFNIFIQLRIYESNETERKAWWLLY